MFRIISIKYNANLVLSINFSITLNSQMQSLISKATAEH